MAAAAAVAALAWVLTVPKQAPFAARPEPQRPELLLLTGLPIVFPERFSLDAGGSPVLDALNSRYTVAPISVSSAGSLRGHRLLLMAQPRAQPAEALVDLDSWVQRGGHVLLLADPMLQWPSERARSDPLHPPLAFADTGLLNHWGLALQGRSADTIRLKEEGRRITTAAPGSLVARSANCAASKSGFIVRCNIGRGTAVVIADSDFIDARRFGPANLQLLFDELARLEQ